MKRALILDTETDGTEATSKVLELGLVLYSIEAQSTLLQFSALLPVAEENPAQHINRISPAALVDVAGVMVDVNRIALAMLEAADVVVAHNAAFDHQFFRGAILEKPWLCTMEDFTWPNQTKGREGLVSLCLAHGIGVSSAHRALTDCQLIAALFDRMTDLPGMFEHALRPKALYQAMVRFEDKDKAKNAGFSWEADKKRWVRRLSVEDAAALPFKTMQLGPAGVGCAG